MADWAYKATTRKLGFQGTRSLAERGFLCRSAYKHGDRRSLNSHVGSVEPGDVIHFYYKHPDNDVTPLGAFEVLPRSGVKHDWILRTVQRTALVAVKRSFVGSVDTQGEYEPDPVEKEFTGWLLARRGKALKYDRDWHLGRVTLCRIEP